MIALILHYMYHIMAFLGAVGLLFVMGYWVLYKLSEFTSEDVQFYMRVCLDIMLFAGALLMIAALAYWLNYPGVKQSLQAFVFTLIKG